MGSFIKFAKSLIRLVSTITAFLMFGYMEHQYNCGFVVSILICIYLFRNNGVQVLGATLVIVNVVSSYFGIKAITVLSFLALDCILLFTEIKQVDDTHVTLRPYESQVRNILFTNEPSRLNCVDALLDEYHGKEKQLLAILAKQYEGGPVRTPPPSARKAPKTPATTFSLFSSPLLQPSSVPDQNCIESPEKTFLQPVASSAPTPRTTFASTVMKIKNILQRHDPALLGSLDRMLEEYRGKENDLLLEIQEEYLPNNASNVEIYTSGSSFTSPAGTTATANTNMPDINSSSSSPFPYAPADVYSVPSTEYLSPRMPFSPAGGVLRTSSNSGKNYPSQYNDEGDMNMHHHMNPAGNHNRHYEYSGSVGVSGASGGLGGGDDTPRTAPTSYSQQRNNAVRQAQEDARREMQARIDARWGAKPTSSSSSAQRRSGYSYKG